MTRENNELSEADRGEGMSYAFKKCQKCGKEFLTGGFGIAVQRTCDMCSEPVKWPPNSQPETEVKK